MALPQDLLMAPSIKIAGHLKLAEIVYKQVVQYNFIILILLSVIFRVFRERVPSEPVNRGSERKRQIYSI